MASGSQLSVQTASDEKPVGEVNGFGPMRHAKRQLSKEKLPAAGEKKEVAKKEESEDEKKQEKKEEEDDEDCLGYTTKEKEAKHAAWRRQTSELWKAMTATLKPLLVAVVAARKSSSKPKKTTGASSGASSKPSSDSSSLLDLLRDEAAMARLCETFAAQMKQLHHTIEEHEGSRNSQDPKKMIRAVVLVSARLELSAPSRERLTALIEPLKLLEACMWKLQMCACTCHLCENCGGSGGDCCPLEYTENCECNC